MTQKLPTMNERQKEIDEWARKSIPVLKKYGYLNSNTNQKKNHNFLFYYLFFALGIIFCAVFFYAISQDAFKTELNQIINPPNVSLSTENNYEFNPSTENLYENNFTIINNIICSNIS